MKFYGRYGDLTEQYEVSLSRMLHDILEDDQYSDTLHWWGITPIFDPFLIWTVLPNLTFYLILWGVQRVRLANRGRLLLRTPGPVQLLELHVF